MACLYIDRLKYDFQRAHHFSQRANNGEAWHPQSSIERLYNYKCENVPEGSSNVSISVKFNPAAPKIFAIGLHSDCRDTRNHYFSLITIKELLKRYLACLVRRYRSYFRSPSKLVCNENCHQNTCTFRSFVSIVSKCSKEFAKNIWHTGNESSHTTLRCKCKHRRSPNGRSHDAQAFSRNIEKPNFLDERYREHRQDCLNMREKVCRCSRTVKDVNSKDDQSSLKIERTVDHTVSSSRSNASGDAHFKYKDSPISTITKRSISVQTSRRSESHRKDHRKKRCGRNRKEKSASTKIPFPQDVETIFKTNSEDFNWKESNLNLDLLETQKKKDACVAWRARGKRRSNTLINGNGNSSGKQFSEAQYSRSKENHDWTTISQKCAKRDRRSVATKIQTILTNKYYNIELSETEISNEIQFHENRAPPNTRREVFLADSIETRCDRLSSPRDYQVKDKSSETIILGNIKKRLEEDYDDYFSFDEYIMNDGFDVYESCTKPIPSFDQSSSGTTIDYHMAENISDTTMSTRKTESLSRYQRPKYSEEDLLVRGASPKESIQTNLKYSFSIHCTNSNLSHSQSSYYTPSQDQDGSQLSSVEYYSASNNSSSNFSRASSNFNLLATLRTHPSNTSATRNCAHETPPLSISSPHEFLLKSDPILQSSGESLSEATVDWRLMQIHQRRSSSMKNASNLSKLVTESFDSGVLLTDCSRDKILYTNERSRKMRRQISRAERNCCATELNLVPASDFSSNSSYSDESLDRRLDVAVKQFTDNLVLAERKMRLKLRRLEKPSRSKQRRRRQSRRQQMQKQVQSDSSFNFYWSQDDDKIASSSTPPIFSLSDSEIDHI